MTDRLQIKTFPLCSEPLPRILSWHEHTNPTNTFEQELESNASRPRLQPKQLVKMHETLIVIHTQCSQLKIDGVHGSNLRCRWR